MPRYHLYVKGDWKAVCDICGREFLMSELRRRWDGFMVCSNDWEPRHPQDFVRGVADIQAPPLTRPETDPQYILACSTRTCISGNTAGCMISGLNIPFTIVPTSSFIEP